MGRSPAIARRYSPTASSTGGMGSRGASASRNWGPTSGSPQARQATKDDPRSPNGTTSSSPSRAHGRTPSRPAIQSLAQARLTPSRIAGVSSKVQAGTISIVVRPTWRGTMASIPITPSSTAVIRRGIAIPQTIPTAKASITMAAMTMRS